ncbi:NADPH:quinone oxidoreductase [Longibacter salinarum]|uniref:NADPH:quinone oxidoreductase n=1 Tax=Longibacter salinarum TaxID=1850348 RepID=A0A2A8D2P5_9BACT|nr:NAD(P)H-quinone oxidoreductase [Longibacter salinarum]PEN15242.1 NADPH:quinone oxidoreductase [Longibacter salinarum]
MQAVIVTEPGEPSNMTIGEVPSPELGVDEVRVNVHATALNRADTFQRRGYYPPPEGESEILGLEMAGVVDDVASGVVDWKQGDRVFALLGGGGYAEEVVVHKDLLMAIPPGLSMTDAAAIPEVFLTAYQALHWLGDLDSTSRVLVHAGASGVGTAALQLIRSAGASAIATASAPKHDVCRTHGADRVVDYRSENFVEAVEDWTDGGGVDLIIDFIGAPYFHKNIEALAMDGIVVQLATLGGATVEEMSLRDLMAKRVHLKASTLRSRSHAYKTRLTEEFAAYALPKFIDGELKPVIDSVMDWSDVTLAHERMENNENAGKIVLRIID